MTLVLDDENVQRLLDPLALVHAIEDALRAEPEQPSVVPERINLSSAGRFFRLMPAIVPSAGVMGLKTFFGGSGVGVRYVLLLVSIETGEVLATMDACYLTAARTAATSAVGSRALGLKASTIGILGSGLEAEAHARTFAALGGVERISVFSPNEVNRVRFAERLGRELDVEVVPAASAEALCADVEHLITATNTGYGGPIACESAWIPRGSYVTAIGSTHQDLRELDVDVLRRADLLVFDTHPAQIADESGDIRAFLDAGGDLDGVLQLDDVIHGTVIVPPDPDDLTVFKSVGTALQDLVAANLAYRRAVDAGVGRSDAPLAVPKARR